MVSDKCFGKAWGDNYQAILHTNHKTLQGWQFNDNSIFNSKEAT